MSTPQLRYLFTADDPRAYKAVRQYQKDVQPITIQELASGLSPDDKSCLCHQAGLIDDLDLAPVMDKIANHAGHPGTPVRMKATLYVYELLRHILGKRSIAETEQYVIPFAGWRSILFGECVVDDLVMCRLLAPNVRPLPLSAPVCILKVLLTHAPGVNAWDTVYADVALHELRSLPCEPAKSDLASFVRRNFEPLPSVIPAGRDTVIRIPYTASGRFDLTVSAPAPGDRSWRYRTVLADVDGGGRVISDVVFDVTSTEPASVLAAAILATLEGLQEQGDRTMTSIFASSVHDACEINHARHVAETAVTD